jgi:hypothetical protein
MATNRIYIQVQFQGEEAGRDIDALNQKLANVGSTSEKATKQAAKGMQSVNVSVHDTADEMAKLARAVAALGVARGFQQLIGMGEEWNRIVRQFSRAGLSDQLEELKALAERAGVLQDQLARMSFSMQAAGIPAKDLAKNMQYVLDITAAYGIKGVDSMEAFTEALSKVGASFNPTAKSIQAIFASVKMNLPQEAAEGLGKTLAELKSSARQMDPEAFVRYALAMLSVKTNGAAAKDALVSVEAASNRLQNQVINTAADLDKKLGPSFIKLLDFASSLVNMFGRLLDIFDRLPGPIKDITVLIGGLTGAIIALGLAISVVTTGFGAWRSIGGLLKGAGAGAAAAGAGAAAAGARGTLGLGGAAAAATSAVARRSAEAAVETATKAATEAAARAAAATAAKAAAKETAKAVAKEVATSVAGGLAGEALAGAMARRAAANAAAKEAAKIATEAAANAAATVAAQKVAQTALGKAGGAVAGAGAAAAAGAATGVATEVVAATGVRAALAGLLGLVGGPVGLIAIVVGLLGGAVLQYLSSSRAKAEAQQKAAGAGYGPATPEEIARLKAGLPKVDVEEMKRQVEQAMTVLEEAQVRNRKAGQETISALTSDYEQYFRKVKGNDQAIAIYRKTLWLDVNTEVTKREEESRREQAKLNEDIAKAQRQTAIAEMEKLRDHTFAGQRELVRLRTEANVEEMRTNVAAKEEEIKRVGDLQLKGIREAGRKARKSEEQIRQEQQRYADAANADILKLAEFRKNEEKRIRVEGERETNGIILEERKQLMEESIQMELLRINRTATLEGGYLYARRPRTPQERMQNIADITDVERVRIEKTRDAQIAAENERLRVFRNNNATSEASIIEETKRTTERIEGIWLDADTALQVARLQGWSQTNDVIIQQQEEMFGEIKGFIGDMWDALLDRSRSVWQSLGNLMKNTMLGVMKTIVTNSMTAQLAGIFGGFKTQFPRGPWRGPWFPGMGQTAPTIYGSAQTDVTYATQESRNREVVGRDVDAIVTDAAREAWSARSGSAADVAGVGATGATGGGGVRGQWSQSVQAMRESLNIGKPVQVRDPVTGAISTKPWAQLTGRQKLGAMLNSPGMGAMAAAVGTPMFMAGALSSKRGVRAGLMGIAGGALAGYGLGKMVGHPVAGAVAGAGLGLFAAGYKRGGVTGAAMSIGGGALAGAGIGFMIGAMFGPMGALIGAGVGLIAGAAAGGIATLVRHFRKPKEEQVRRLIRNAYGVDIVDRSIREQVVQIADQRFGGDLRMAVFSPEVQEMVRLYALNTNQGVGGMPRQMYGATFAQSAAGGLQLQPVYSNGRMVANPYVGTTTTQVANALQGPNPMFLQLNPQQATSLFSGQVVQVLGNNPGAVGAANTTAARSGQGRAAQTGALLEPSTVMA